MNRQTYYLSFRMAGDWIITYDTLFFQFLVVGKSDFEDIVSSCQYVGNNYLIADRDVILKHYKLKQSKKDIAQLASIITTPLYACIEITRSCNLQCVYCYASKEPVTNAFNLSELGHVIHNAPFLMGITITGGEPFLCRDLEKILSFCQKESMIVTIDTNGTLLNSKIDAALLEILKLPNMNLKLSLDSIDPNINNALRGQGTDVLSSIKKLRQIGICVRINTVITSLNISSLDHIARFLLDNRIENWALLRLVTNREPSLAQFSVPKDYEIQVVTDIVCKYQGKIKIDYNRKKSEYSLLLITCDGFYSLPGSRNRILGNISNTNLKDIWQKVEKVSHIVRYLGD